MKDRYSFRPSLAAGSLTAAVALLVGMNLASAQAPAPAAPLSGAGSFPNSFIVPGTNTSLHVGGQVQVDMSYSMNDYGGSSTPGAYDNLAPGSVGVEGPGVNGSLPHTNSHVFRLTANNTRPYFETRTPTAYGEMKTYIEFDFAGGQNTAGPASGGATSNKCCADDGIPRVRQAYGTLGPWLFGKTNSNFADLAALADTLDAFVQAGGFMGAGTVRQTQIRYTWLLPAGISASASVENVTSAGLLGTDATGKGATSVTFNDYNSPGVSQQMPAINGKVQIQQPWGHAAFAMAVQQERLDNDAPGGSLTGSTTSLPGGAHFKRYGYMLAQSGHLNTFGKDRFTWSIEYGQGAAQYAWALNELGTQWEEGLVCNLFPGNRVECSQPRVFGINAGYSHFWTDEWRSGVSVGYDDVSRPNSAGPWSQGILSAGSAGSLAKLEHRHYSAGVSLFWTPVAAVQFGLGYLYYHREVWSGAKGSAHRLLSQAVFQF